MPLVTEMTWRTLTQAVSELRRPNSFLTQKYFPESTHQNLSTETLSVDKWRTSRVMARFNKKNAAANMVAGITREFNEIMTPSIREKMPITPALYAFERTPGSTLFINEAEQQARINEAVAMDLSTLEDRILDRIEWMIGKLLTGGAISYADDLGDAWTVNFGRDATHTVTLAGADLWNTTTADILGDLNEALQAGNDKGHSYNDLILGTTAAAAFMNNAKVQALLDNRRFTAGELTLMKPFTDSGARPLGTIDTLTVWTYGRSVFESDGVTSVKIIPDAGALLVSDSPQSEFKMYFGAIPEIDENSNDMIRVGPRFSKQWVTPDPPAKMILNASRPLPVLRRPESTYFLTVL